MFWKNLFKKASAQKQEEPLAKKAPSDRRRDPRIEEEKEIIMEVVDPQVEEMKEAELPARSLDISVGGMRLESGVEFRPETLVRLRLPSDRLDKWIQVTGKIKWVKQAEKEKVIELGLEFIDTPPETILDLMEHIYRRPS